MRGRSRRTADSSDLFARPSLERLFGDPPARLVQKHREQQDRKEMLIQLLLEAESAEAKPSRVPLPAGVQAEAIYDLATKPSVY
ncbi:MAG: hypothetical protein HXY51_04365 [Nitrospirae bacterium]|nr:hypothetical protein [Nitrospirota bacterium]